MWKKLEKEIGTKTFREDHRPLKCMDRVASYKVQLELAELGENENLYKYCITVESVIQTLHILILSEHLKYNNEQSGKKIAGTHPFKIHLSKTSSLSKYPRNPTVLNVVS